MAELHCRHFTGYKPCSRNHECSRASCAHYAPITQSVLVVHLEALGAVLRSTSLLKAIRRQFPNSHLTWVTQAPAHHLLAQIEDIDRVLTLSNEDILRLRGLSFDVALVIDKSLAAWGVVQSTQVREVRGFFADAKTGAIVPANPEAKELWDLGLNDELKFFHNTKSEQHLVHEALALGPYLREPYQCRLSRDEMKLAQDRRALWSPSGRPVVGLNTGCSATLPAKKLSIEGHRELISRLQADPRFAGIPLVLLGGPEDEERNRAIAQGLPVIVSPTKNGLRDGLASVAACDVVITGDSLGMHMAIALAKWVVAWFGPSCAQEIDLYDRGVKVLTRAGCSPCWKRSCEKALMCYDQVDFNQMIDGAWTGIEWHISSFKPHSQETSSSVSHYSKIFESGNQEPPSP